MMIAGSQRYMAACHVPWAIQLEIRRHCNRLIWLTYNISGGKPNCQHRWLGLVIEPREGMPPTLADKPISTSILYQIETDLCYVLSKSNS